jgi:hypothetical protein
LKRKYLLSKKKKKYKFQVSSFLRESYGLFLSLSLFRSFRFCQRKKQKKDFQLSKKE